MLQGLPPRFDERIHLPLPFLNRMVLGIYRQRPAAVVEFLGYLTTRTNQDKRAARLMEAIVLENAGRCLASREVAALGTGLAWLPNPLPAAAGPCVTPMLEIAQGVAAALASESFHHRKELLERPLADLQRFRMGLTRGRTGSKTPAWGEVANRWQQLLTNTHATLAEEARQAGEIIPQAYMAGQALRPELAKGRFKGRQDVFRRMEELVLSPQPPLLLLLGGRRLGKSSSLNYLPEKMGPEWVPLVLDGQGLAVHTSAATLALGLAVSMYDAARHSRRLTLPRPEEENFASAPFSALQRWMQRAEESLPEGKRFLLCLDEFERLTPVVAQAEGRALLDLLRNLAQHRKRWVVLFSGVHALKDLPPQWSDCLINTQTVRIGLLQEKEARELILHPIPEFPAIYHPQALEEILRLTRRHPYLIQLLCTLLVERLNEQQRTLLQPEEVEQAIPLLFERGEGYFNEWWSQLDAGQRQVLRQVRDNLPLAAEQVGTVRRLLRQEVLEAAETGEYRFQLPLLQRYFDLQDEESL
ncbi:MAG: hypothetical protein HQM06_04325 [Magnetococcales bacterium]|nr:hypothetical protein [Magnetococcales bacterium]